MKKREINCFKAYDIRGVLGETIDENIAYLIGLSFAETMDARTVVVGYDARETSPLLARAVSQGLLDAGCNVLDIKQAGTEELYYATSFFEADGGIEVTASHNPINYNGMKLVGKGSRPLDPDLELPVLKAKAEAGEFKDVKAKGTYKAVSFEARDAYIQKLMTFVEIPALRPLKVVVNCGNGAAGHAYKALKTALNDQGAPLQFIDQYIEPDQTFPNGIPNPILVENQDVTRDMVLSHKADIGVAFDGDFDRCFFFDEQGRFIPGEYIVSLLANVFLDKEPGCKIVHDPRVVMNIRDIVANKNGHAVQSKTGHAFIKKIMREQDAVYGGEMSAHHYFRDFCYCDSGMIPFLLVCELMGRANKPLSELVAERMRKFPSSGERNFKIADPEAASAAVVARYNEEKIRDDRSDGVSFEFDAWRFNLRASNTEPLVRLNVESDGNPDLVQQKLAEIEGILKVYQ